MAIQRIPLVPDFNNRNSTNTKDAVAYNCFYETYGNKRDVVKRPGLYNIALSPTIPSGEGQGIFSWNNYIIVAQTNNIYGILGNTSVLFGSITGTTQPLSFTQVANDNYLVFHNGANLYVAKKTTTNTVTITVASPAVVTWTAFATAGLGVGSGLIFASTGTLPTGITAGVKYYIQTILTADTFTLRDQNGNTINTTGAGSGTYSATIAYPVIKQAIVNDTVTGVNVVLQGTGYITQPTVTFSASPGTTATGYATIANKQITGIVITNPGAGYLAPPTVSISAPTQVSAIATASVTNLVDANTGVSVGAVPGYFGTFKLNSISITYGGLGYQEGVYYDVILNTYISGVLQNSSVVGVAYCKGDSIVSADIFDIYPANKVPYLNNTYNYVVTFSTPNPAITATATPSMGNSIAGPYATGLAYLNGRIFVMTTAGKIYQSAIDDPTTWGASDFLYANSDPDAGVALIRHLNYLVAFGQWSTDFFYDAGNPTNSVLSPYQAAKLEIGCAAGTTVAKAEHTVFWVGQGLTEGKGVYMFEGITPKKISSRYVDKILNADNFVKSHSFCMKLNGHTMYVLTLVSSNLTLVYDVEERSWYRWTSQTGGAEGYFKYTYYTGNVEYSPANYIQHETNGQLYVMDDSYYNDSGDSIYFRVKTPIYDFGSVKRKFYRKVEIVGDKVVGTLSINHSDDDYTTYNNFRTVNLQDNRPVLYQCGSSRRRSWQIFSSDNIPIRLEALEIDITEGEQG